MAVKRHREALPKIRLWSHSYGLPPGWWAASNISRDSLTMVRPVTDKLAG